MGKSKKYVVISGFEIHDNNRGTAALGYGAIPFLYEKGYLHQGNSILNIKIYKNPFNKNYHNYQEQINIAGETWVRDVCYVFFLEYFLLKIGLRIPFLRIVKIINNIELIAAINGGDGFSDIYDKKTFHSRLPEIKVALLANIPLILLPQTVGPFNNTECLQLATRILKYASIVYVRDDCFVPELKNMSVNYKITNDLSYYMQPEPWDIEINTNNSVGLNISGLAWDNKFHTLAGQFEYYPMLIMRIIELFQKKGKTIYLISHSYNYNSPELFNDDLKASKEAYNRLRNKKNVVLLDQDLNSPQVKYLISRMSFFIGTRMHANYAAIFSKVPLFGLAYSYKFKGAFERNNIYNRVAEISNIDLSKIEDIVEAIDSAYIEDVEN